MKQQQRSRSPEPFRNVLTLGQAGVYVQKKPDPYSRQLERMKQFALSVYKPKEARQVFPKQNPSKYKPLLVIRQPRGYTIAKSPKLHEIKEVAPVIKTADSETKRFTDNVGQYLKRQANGYEEYTTDGQLSARKYEIIKELGETLYQVETPVHPTAAPNGEYSDSSVDACFSNAGKPGTREPQPERGRVTDSGAVTPSLDPADMDAVLKENPGDYRRLKLPPVSESARVGQNQALDIPAIPKFKGISNLIEDSQGEQAAAILSARLPGEQLNSPGEKPKNLSNDQANSRIPEIPSFKGQVVPRLIMEDHFTKEFIYQVKTVRGVKREKYLYNSRFQQVHVDLDADDDLDKQLDEFDYEYLKSVKPEVPRQEAGRGRFNKQEVTSSFLQNYIEIIDKNSKIVEKQSRFAKQQIGFNEKADEEEDEFADELEQELKKIDQYQQQLYHELDTSSYGIDKDLNDVGCESSGEEARVLAYPRVYKRFAEEKMNASFYYNQMEIIGQARPIIEQGSRFEKQQKGMYTEDIESSGSESYGAKTPLNNGDEQIVLAKSRFNVLASVNSFQQDQQQIIQSAHEIKDKESRFEKVYTGSFDANDADAFRDAVRSKLPQKKAADNIQFQKSARGPRYPVTESRFQVQKQLDEISDASTSEAQPGAGAFLETPVCRSYGPAKEQSAASAYDEKQNPQYSQHPLQISDFSAANAGYNTTAQSRLNCNQYISDISDESEEVLGDGVTQATKKRVNLQCMPSFMQNQIEIIEREIRRENSQPRFKALGEDEDENAEDVNIKKTKVSRFKPLGSGEGHDLYPAVELATSQRRRSDSGSSGYY